MRLFYVCSIRPTASVVRPLCHSAKVWRRAGKREWMKSRTRIRMPQRSSPASSIHVSRVLLALSLADGVEGNVSEPAGVARLPVFCSIDE